MNLPPNNELFLETAWFIAFPKAETKLTVSDSTVVVACGVPTGRAVVFRTN